MIPYEMHKHMIIFGKEIAVWFVFHYILSWAFGFYYLVKESLRRKDININFAVQMFLFAFLGALAGARAFAFFGPWSIGCIEDSIGWVAFGGMFGAFFFAYLCAKFNRISFLRYIDVSIPGVALGMSIARIGCFIADCCFGTITSVPWAVIKDGVPIHPTQLYLSLMNLGIFLIVLHLNEKREREKKFNGYLFFSFLVMYSIGRFITEFLRGDYLPPNYFYGLTSSQIVSIITILVFAPILIVKLMQEKPRKKSRSGFHIMPKTYAIIIAGGILLNIGAYIITPMPYIAILLILLGLSTLIIGINSIFKKQKINK